MAQLSVTGTASALVDGVTNGPMKAILKNMGSATVYLDSAFGGIGSGVTSSNGFALAAGESISMDVAGTDVIYGVTAGSTVTVHRMRLA